MCIGNQCPFLLSRQRDHLPPPIPTIFIKILQRPFWTILQEYRTELVPVFIPESVDQIYKLFLCSLYLVFFIPEDLSRSQCKKQGSLRTSLFFIPPKELTT